MTNKRPRQRVMEIFTLHGKLLPGTIMGAGNFSYDVYGQEFKLNLPVMGVNHDYVVSYYEQGREKDYTHVMFRMFTGAGEYEITGKIHHTYSILIIEYIDEVIYEDK